MPSLIPSLKKATFWVPVLIVGLYLLLHLPLLTHFPVFADEAIYIRWAQLIMDDAQRYAFFALNDGKTPFFIWLLVPFQSLFANQLFAGRVVAVLAGVFQLFVIKALIKSLGGKPAFQWYGMLLTTCLPFWLFAHQLALMDGWLTLWLSLTTLGLIQITQQRITKNTTRQLIVRVLWTGAAFGCAIWTKLPALFFLLAFPLFTLLPAGKSWRLRATYLVYLGAAAALGLGMFVLLKFSPAFGQLFSRGRDFSYPVTEVLSGHWRDTLINIPKYLWYLCVYLTWPVMLLAATGMFLNETRRKTAVLLASGAVFCLPFVLLGKVVYARYFLPVSIFLTVASVLSLQALYQKYLAAEPRLHAGKLAVALILTVLISSTLYASSQFGLFFLLAPNATPFVAPDRQQYLEEWSSGHGIVETVAYIREQAKTHSIAVATEGRFGSLPDALLLYFHGTNTHNIYIEGTGQYPVKSLPDFFVQRAQNSQQVILVVNSHRMQIPLSPDKLLAEYCRPRQAPCLQIWDVTALAHTPPSP